MLTALQLIKNQLKGARDLFEGTVGDITEEALHKDPGGKAFSLAATYAHLIFSEDAIVQGMLQGKPPLYATTWKDKTGASSPMPAMDDKWAVNNENWSRTVQINLNQLKKYSKAVYEATDEYVSSLKESDLEKEVDLGAWGKHTVADMLSGFVIGHTNNLTGEISALKGIHGAKGYPF